MSAAERMAKMRRLKAAGVTTKQVSAGIRMRITLDMRRRALRDEIEHQKRAMYVLGIVRGLCNEEEQPAELLH